MTTRKFAKIACSLAVAAFTWTLAPGSVRAAAATPDAFPNGLTALDVVATANEYATGASIDLGRYAPDLAESVRASTPAEASSIERKVRKLVTFRRSAGSHVPARFADIYVSHHPGADRAALQKFFEDELDQFATAIGSPNRDRMVDISSAEALLVAQSYYSFDADQPSDATSYKILRALAGLSLANQQKRGAWPDGSKQDLFDTFAILAETLVSITEDARHRGDDHTFDQIRNAAHSILSDRFGVDPSKTKVDRLICVVYKDQPCDRVLARARIAFGGAGTSGPSPTGAP